MCFVTEGALQHFTLLDWPVAGPCGDTEPLEPQAGDSSAPCVRAGWLAWAGSDAGRFVLLADPELQVMDSKGSLQHTSL